jgi:hypothetical protein
MPTVVTQPFQQLWLPLPVHLLRHHRLLHNNSLNDPDNFQQQFKDNITQYMKTISLRISKRKDILFGAFILVFFISNLFLTNSLFAQITQEGGTTNVTEAYVLDANSTNLLTINKPTVNVGDIMIANISALTHASSNSGYAANCSGWTLISYQDIEDGGGQHTVTSLYRVVDGTESSSFTFTIGVSGTNCHGAGAIIAFSGVSATGGYLPNGQTGGPFDVTPGSYTYSTTASTSISGVISITTASANAAVLMLVGAFDDATSVSAFTVTSPTLNSLYSYAQSSSSPAGTVGVGENIMTTAGSTGNGSATLGASEQWAAILIALKPGATNYYNKSSGASALQTLSNWGTSTDGTGTAPSSFTADGQVFNITNGTTATIGAAWTVSGTGSKVVLGSSSVAAITFTVPSSYAFSGSIDISAALSGSNTLILNNSTIPTIGTLNSGSTVNYNISTGAQTVASGTYGILTLSNSSGTDDAGGAITATTLNTTSGGTLNMGTNTLTVTNVTNAGTITTQNTSSTPITSGKTWGGIVEYNGSGSQTAVSGTYSTLDINNTSGVTLSGTTTVTNLTIGDVTSGSIFNDGGNTLNATGTLTLASGGTFNLGNNSATSWPGFATNTISPTSTVGYISPSSSGQTVSTTPAYGNLKISGAYTKKPSSTGTLTVGGDLTVSAGTLALNSYNNPG